MTIEELAQIAGANGLTLNDTQQVQLATYAELLREKNQLVNLISRKDEENILDKHILHSLTIAMPQVTGFALPPGATVFDIGTGGGLPGIPLSIARTDLSTVICDSIVKKITAANEFIIKLGLSNCKAVIGRTEELANKPEHRSHYDFIVSRAVAPLDELLTWSRRLMKNGATLLSLKGGDLGDEIARIKKMHGVKEVDERLLTLENYPGFAGDEKKVVRVLMQ